MTLNNYKDDWEFAVGVYPGFLFGMRTYQEPGCDTYVFYLPFINLLLTLYK
jgi:hypothetical protein